jgi:lipooligosaccharide transport system permease protein
VDLAIVGFAPWSRPELLNFNPLRHCVELVRHAAFGWDGWTDIARLGALVAFGLIMWRIAIHAMTRKLID